MTMLKSAKLALWTRKAVSRIGMRERNVDRWGCLLWVPLLMAASAFPLYVYAVIRSSPWGFDFKVFIAGVSVGILAGMMAFAGTGLLLWILRLVMELVCGMFER
jgi:hypothetical protein